MKFVQKDLGDAAEASAGKGSQAREFVKLVLTILLLMGIIYIVLGLVVDLVVRQIEPETEAKLFSGLRFAAVSSTAHAKEQKRLAAILEKISAAPGIPKLSYRLFIMVREEPNAFAFPGGVIGVTSGLIKELGDDEIAWAFILGHELGHFKGRDHLRGMGRAIGMGICNALIFGDGMSGDWFVSNISTLMARKYSRLQEEAGDRTGVELVYRVYGHSNGTDRLFQILQKKAKTPRWAYMFSSHPDPQSRIKALQAHAKELKE